jgi:hypothetical protein
VFLMNITVFCYSAYPLTAGHMEAGLRDENYRTDPFISPPLEMRKGFNENDRNLLKLYPYFPVYGATFPDSFNFLRGFYRKKLFLPFYSESNEQEKIGRKVLTRPDAQPVLLWLSNDSFEPDELAVYPEKGQADELLASNDLLRNQLLDSFFGRKLLIYVNGFQQYETLADRKGRTILTNLKAPRYFTDRINLGPIRWLGDGEARSADFARALKQLHPALTEFIKSCEGTGIKIEEFTKEARSFSYFYLLWAITAPFFLWIFLKVSRFLFFVRVRG